MSIFDQTHLSMSHNPYIQENKARFLAELFDLIRIPSISADSQYKADVQKAADKVGELLRAAGCDTVEIHQTSGHPIVYGEKVVGANLPTVLVYGHYDVQPATPLDLWETPPFEPTVRTTAIHPQGAIFARGACDDKGQMFMHIKALEIMLANGELPCNIKFMIEGEEEVGSVNLEAFVKQNKARLANDIILISDTGMIGNSQPSITTGLRGLSYVEVEVAGPNRDLHSGLYGGAVANPINILAKMIASLHDADNRVSIPGFYDDVVELSEKERNEIAKTPFSQEEYQDALQIEAVYGEKGYSTLERNSIRPTLDVNGIWGGYMGEGAKTVIASKAFAKISMRLVSNQDWKKISELFTNHFKSIAPKGVKVEVKIHHGGQAYLMPIGHIGYRAAFEAYRESFGVAPLPQYSGGSIPIVALFEKELGVKSVLMGFGLDSDAIHSPNEHFGIFNFLKGIETIPLFYKHYIKLYRTDN